MNKGSLFSLEGVSFSYGEREILSGLDLDIPKKRLVSIVGVNGSGKTTLFNLLTGLKKAKSGKILFLGEELSKMKSRDRSEKFSVLHQGIALSFPYSCIELVIFGLFPFMSRFQKLTDKDYARVKKAMELTDTYQFASKPFSSLSGGEKQRVFLARAIVGSPKVIFLDESMSELDVSGKIKMTKLIKAYAEENDAYIIEISHDISLSYQLSDYLIAMKNGKITASGEPKKVIDEQFFRDNFSVEAEIIEEKGFFIKEDI